MSFRANQHLQISLFDHENWLTEREQKALEKSWAKVFADEIFPAIDETRFSVLYSDKGDLCEVDEYKLLLRCLEEQTITDNGIRRIRDKGDELPSPKSLQSPYDPEATFRTKAGKKHVGYIAMLIVHIETNVMEK